MRETWKWLFDIENEFAEDYNCHAAVHKHAQNLTLEEVFTTDAVYITAYRCSIGFQNKKDTQNFMESAFLNSYKLAEKVRGGKFKPHYYRERKIIERGKERTIKPPTFESKVVQKVLCDYVIRPMFENRMISTNYASVRGRGTASMYGDILKALFQSEEENVIIMTDFTGYFPSIDTEILRNIYNRYLKDQRVTDLIMMFSPEEQGLFLGNETSQVPASFFPSYIDHYFKDRLGIKHYFRYCDDILFIAENEKEADFLIDTIKSLSKDLNLTLKDEKIKKVRYAESFVFCKERFIYGNKNKEYYRMMNPQIYKNEAKKLKAFNHLISEGKMNKESAVSQYRGVKGSIVSRENTYRQIQRLDQLYNKTIETL